MDRHVLAVLLLDAVVDDEVKHIGVAGSTGGNPLCGSNLAGKKDLWNELTSEGTVNLLAEYTFASGTLLHGHFLVAGSG